MGGGASTGVAAAVGAAKEEDLRAALGSLPPEVRARLKVALCRQDVIVRIPEDKASGGSLHLSPLDLATMGRATPMLWFYRDSLDTDKLLSSLEETLAAYPVLSGRYDGKLPPRAVELSNRGVPVQLWTPCAPWPTLDEAVGHLPPSASSGASACFFSRTLHEAYVPEKEGMDPDQGSAEAPLLKIKITLFPKGGTAIGMLCQHTIVDADSQIAFLKSWSRTYRGLDLDLVPNHERALIAELPTGEFAKGEKPPDFKVIAVPAGEKRVPAFAPLMPKIGGNHVAAVPFSKSHLHEMTQAVTVSLPKESGVSTDDVLSARVWRALLRMRCQQVGLSEDCEETTTLSRACNIRMRTEPPLGRAYFGNAATQIWTSMPVRELCSVEVAEVALRMRASIRKETQTPERLAARMQWCGAQHEKGCTTPLEHDKLGLTFVLSSWMFDWEGVDFNAKPVGFDHGAHVPIVSVFTPRPEGDGVLVYASGPEGSVQHFARLLTESGP